MTNEPMSNMTNECASCLALLPEYHASAEYPLCVSCDRNCLADAYRAAEANMVALTADLRETRSALAAAQAECERLRALVNRAADSLDYCVQRHGEYNKSVRGDELRAAAKEGLT